MNELLSAHEAVCRLLAATWDPESLPTAEAIPWHEVLSLVGPSNVAGVVYGVTRGMREAIPAAVEHTLEQAYYWSAAQNICLMNQLARIGPALASAGGPLLLLKGAALVPMLYAGLGPRLIGDIDLLVAPERVPACRKVLLELGYLPAHLEPHDSGLLAYGTQEELRPSGPDRASVELHWHALDVPYYGRTMPVDWFWENAETRAIAGQPFQVLKPEANLVYLPAHLALHHKFRGLHSYLDLALLIVKNEGRLDWEQIVTAARELELLSALAATLERLARWWPALPLAEPRRLVARVEPSAADARLFRLLAAESGNRNIDFYARVVSLPDLPAQVHFALQNLFPQPAYMVGRYPIKASWQLPYWYVYRVVDGFGRYLRTRRDARRLEHERP